MHLLHSSSLTALSHKVTSRRCSCLSKGASITLADWIYYARSIPPSSALYPWSHYRSKFLTPYSPASLNSSLTPGPATRRHLPSLCIWDACIAQPSLQFLAASNPLVTCSTFSSTTATFFSSPPYLISIPPTLSARACTVALVLANCSVVCSSTAVFCLISLPNPSSKSRMAMSWSPCDCYSLTCLA